MKDSTNFIDKCNESQDSIDKKLLNEFKKYEKGFDGKSKPVYWNHCGEKTTLKKIHDDANIGDISVAIIAVTREQYNIENFSNYRKYIKNPLKFKNMSFSGSTESALSKYVSDSSYF